MPLVDLTDTQLGKLCILFDQMFIKYSLEPTHYHIRDRGELIAPGNSFTVEADAFDGSFVRFYFTLDGTFIHFVGWSGGD